MKWASRTLYKTGGWLSRNDGRVSQTLNKIGGWVSPDGGWVSRTLNKTGGWVSRSGGWVCQDDGWVSQTYIKTGGWVPSHDNTPFGVLKIYNPNGGGRCLAVIAGTLALYARLRHKRGLRWQPPHVWVTDRDNITCNCYTTGQSYERSSNSILTLTPMTDH